MLTGRVGASTRRAISIPRRQLLLLGSLGAGARAWPAPRGPGKQDRPRSPRPTSAYGRRARDPHREPNGRGSTRLRRDARNAPLYSGYDATAPAASNGGRCIRGPTERLAEPIGPALASRNVSASSYGGSVGSEVGSCHSRQGSAPKCMNRARPRRRSPGGKGKLSSTRTGRDSTASSPISFGPAFHAHHLVE